MQLSGPGGNQRVFQPSTESTFRPDGNQTDIQTGTQSAFKPGKNQTALQPSNLAALKLYSQAAFQPDPPILRSSPPENRTQVSEPSPVQAAPPFRLCPEQWTNQPCGIDFLIALVL